MMSVRCDVYDCTLPCGDNHCLPYHVVTILWSLPCGPNPEVTVLWSLPSGPYHVVNTLWSLPCGDHDCCPYHVASTLFSFSLLLVYVNHHWIMLQISCDHYDIFHELAFYFPNWPDASGSGQLLANPHVTSPWLSPGKPTRRAVTMMGSNDLVVGEDHMFGPSCQLYNWQTGRCGSMAFGSSPRRGKTLASNPRCLAEESTCGKEFRR